MNWLKKLFRKREFFDDDKWLLASYYNLTDFLLKSIDRHMVGAAEKLTSSGIKSGERHQIVTEFAISAAARSEIPNDIVLSNLNATETKFRSIILERFPFIVGHIHRN